MAKTISSAKTSEVTGGSGGASITGSHDVKVMLDQLN